MSTILHIAGHGKKKNGTFDPGAIGFIKEGEHKYYAESFFNLLKKYQPANAKAVYHVEYNVYDYGNIVNLAKQYGKDTVVIEWHFNASANKSATKGHIIIYGGFSPDKLDLRLRDSIESMLGVRNSHRGHKGVDGRYNLGNTNRCAKGGVNYRLIELGFGTSLVDSKIMIEQMDAYAKSMSEAIYNTRIEIVQPQDSMAGYYIVKKGDTLWAIGKGHGVTVAELKNWNNLKSDLIFPGQSLEVQGSDIPGPVPEPKPATAPKAEPTNPIVKGAWVRVPANKLYASGSANSPVKSRELSAQVETINSAWKNPIRLVKNGSYQGFARIADIVSGTQKAIRPDLTKVAIDVINGNYGNGKDRKVNLVAAGYDYNKIQEEVNKILKG